MDLVTTRMDATAPPLPAGDGPPDPAPRSTPPNGYDFDFVRDFGDLFEGLHVLTQFAPFRVRAPAPGGSRTTSRLDETGGTGGRAGRLAQRRPGRDWPRPRAGLHPAEGDRRP